MAQIKPKTNKNIVTVGRLKKIVSDLEKQNYDIEARRKAIGFSWDNAESPDYDEQRLLSENSQKIAKYQKIIQNPSKYKPKK